MVLIVLPEWHKIIGYMAKLSKLNEMAKTKEKRNALIWD